MKDFNRRERLKTLGFLLVMIFLSMSSRTMFAPLIPYLSREVGLNLSQAGLLFLAITLGYSASMLLSGFASARIQHRGTVCASLSVIAAGLTLFAFFPVWPWILAGTLLIGLGAGIYPSSAFSMIDEMFSGASHGTALALHELGPAMAFVAAPPLVVLAERSAGWRALPLGMAAACLAAAAVFRFRARVGRFPGAAPHFHNLGRVMSDPGVWTGMALFTAAFGGGQGVFSFLPAYLTLGKGFQADEVNFLVGASRVISLASILGVGLLIERLGGRLTIFIIIGFSSACTMLLGVAEGLPLKIMAFIQPALLSAFYPPALMALAKIGPDDARNVTLSVVITGAALLGTGVIPAGLGVLGDAGLIGPGFIGLGAAMAMTLPILAGRRSFGT